MRAQIILGNTYHLYLRPGVDTLCSAGGLHKFMSWNKPLLTDSGGYQVYSLAARRKISEEGVSFQSHIDGSRHVFTPENVIDIQRHIGADIIMAFDECPPYPCDRIYAESSLELTNRWLERCVNRFAETSCDYSHQQMLAPIVQGSVFQDLRKKSVEAVTAYESWIYAIGGLSVGEPTEDLYEMTGFVCSLLPGDRARYLMGVGTPQNLLECIALGVDMFDCVLPTRNARHGLIYTREGVINIKNSKWTNDFSPLDPQSDVEVSQRYSKAYVRHLFQSREYLGPQITSLHNLRFFMNLVGEARVRILDGTFSTWKTDLVEKVSRRL